MTAVIKEDKRVGLDKTLSRLHPIRSEYSLVDVTKERVSDETRRVYCSQVEKCKY